MKEADVDAVGSVVPRLVPQAFAYRPVYVLGIGRELKIAPSRAPLGYVAMGPKTVVFSIEGGALEIHRYFDPIEVFSVAVSMMAAGGGFPRKIRRVRVMLNVADMVVDLKTGIGRIGKDSFSLPHEAVKKFASLAAAAEDLVRAAEKGERIKIPIGPMSFETYVAEMTEASERGIEDYASFDSDRLLRLVKHSLTAKEDLLRAVSNSKKAAEVFADVIAYHLEREAKVKMRVAERADVTASRYEEVKNKLSQLRKLPKRVLESVVVRGGDVIVRFRGVTAEICSDGRAFARTDPLTAKLASVLLGRRAGEKSVILPVTKLRELAEIYEAPERYLRKISKDEDKLIEFIASYGFPKDIARALAQPVRRIATKTHTGDVLHGFLTSLASALKQSF